MTITDKDRLDFLDRNRFEIFRNGNEDFCVEIIYAPIFVEEDDTKIIGSSEKLRDAIDKALCLKKRMKKYLIKFYKFLKTQKSSKCY